MNITEKNSSTLVKELAWLSEVIDTRLKLYFNNEAAYQDIKAILPPDVTEDDSAYALFIKSGTLGFEERLVLALTLAPHIKPQLLDVFFTKNSGYDKGFTEFGGLKTKNHGGFIPTMETAVFLLAADEITQRLNLLRFFRESSLFGHKDHLSVEIPETNEPMQSGAICISTHLLNHLTTGISETPDFNTLFPAKKINTRLEWKDLVLDNHILEDIKEIQAWLEHGNLIMQQDHIGKKLKPGYRSLFYGPPGTGKTLTASLLGKTTQREVYRVDLSMVVSKYIGETEKNLAKVFDQAESRQWILFFDEADALFGKRTSTSSSNDRYANQEVSYLLQRIEDFPGVVILASNMKSNMDEAFARRFQSVIHFPMPGPTERLRLWQNAFAGSGLITGDFNFEPIAREYVLSGGAIINVLRYCVLLALRKGKDSISREDIIAGLRKEFHKEGKTL